MHSNASTHWKHRDYQDIKEFVGRSIKTDHPEGERGLAILYCLLALPVILILPFFFLGRTRTFSRKVLNGFHYFMIFISLMGLFVGLGDHSPDNDSNVAMMFCMVFYFCLLIIISKAYYKSIVITPIPIEKKFLPLGQQKVFGTAGNLETTRGKFSDVNIEHGEDGEKRTAKLLEELLCIPGTRIFHGVSWPGSKFADIDHIAINGNKIAFIDSKLWSHGLHVVTEDGNVFTYGRKGSKPVFRKVIMPIAAISTIKYLQRFGFGGLTSYSWLAVHHKNGSHVKTDNTRNVRINLRVLDAKEAVDDIGEWFASGTDGVVHSRLVGSFLKLVKN